MYFKVKGQPKTIYLHPRAVREKLVRRKVNKFRIVLELEK